MINGVISIEATESLTTNIHTLIKEVALRASDLTDCMNIPTHALYAPIAGDYIKFNASPNFGEAYVARLWLDI